MDETINLNVEERISLLNLLPKEGDLTTVKIVRRLRENLSFTEEEHERLQFQQSENSISWKNGFSKEIKISKKQGEIIREALNILDKSKKVTENHLSLFEKFNVGNNL